MEREEVFAQSLANGAIERTNSEAEAIKEINKTLMANVPITVINRAKEIVRSKNIEIN